MKTATVTKLSFDEFEEKFKPVTNPANDPQEAFNGCLFETYGDDLLQVEKHMTTKEGRRHIWTLVEQDGEQFIISGVHFVNRLNYMITVKAAPEGEEIEVAVLDQDEQEAIQASYDAHEEAVKRVEQQQRSDIYRVSREEQELPNGMYFNPDTQKFTHKAEEIELKFIIPQIFITVKGGCVTGVFSSIKNAEVVLIDYDNQDDQEQQDDDQQTKTLEGLISDQAVCELKF